MRVGLGFDIHRLAAGRKLVLGGVEIPGPKGLEGHSDADVILHALCDALLGSVGEGDLGLYFPDNDQKWKGAPSRLFVEKALELTTARGLKLVNADFVVVAEEPRLAPYRPLLKSALAGLLRVEPDRVNIKAKTMEGLGPIGEGKAVACWAVVLLEKEQVD
ncbi:MAG: 2-C-methyl-D-erythritol 2,4-cyclodiphosphate synthase [Candidatus Omnitrophica bacterium]|nr:2-C-methyl-D-erythritol 2,4-cyclodiphosphate synthase [Candidatus Omnitrophota bacterium]